MNRRPYGTLGVMAALALVAVSLAGCKSDPLSDLDGNPSAVVTDFTYLQLSIGSTAAVTARVVDGRDTPLAVPITFTPCTADVAVATDTTYHPVPVTSARAIVTAVTANPSCVEVSGGGLTDSVRVAILPGTFNGTASTASPQVGQLFSLRGTSLLGFDTASASIDFGGGITGTIVRRVLDTLTVRVPQPNAAQPAALTVSGIAVKYVPGLIVSLRTATAFTVTNPFGVHDVPDAVSSTITIPSSGAPDLVFYDGFKTADVDFFYRFTIASTDTVKFTLSWDTAADLDMAACTTGCGSFVGGFGAATGANPETFTVIFAPGTYNLLVEQFAGEAHLFKVVVHNP